MKRYKMFLMSVLVLDFLALSLLVYEKYDERLPESITVKSGEESEISLSVPAMATIYEEKDKTKKNLKIATVNLKEPVYMKASDGKYKMKVSLFGFIPMRSIDLDVMEEDEALALGNVVGIYVHTPGVLVIDITDIKDENGKVVSPSKGILRPGDYIVDVNGEAILTKSDFTRMVNESKGDKLKISIIRDGEKKEVNIIPVKQEDKKEYLIGAWIREDMQGIGTLSFMTKHGYAALGHAINDIDTNNLMSVTDGDIYEADVSRIQKGKIGEPGELAGVIYYQPEKRLGSIRDNTNYGITGAVNEENLDSLIDENEDWMKIALKQDVKLGRAYVISDLSGERKKYEIRITDISIGKHNKEKAIEVKVVDPDLLSTTGGIVQGMSGSPIIQDGKLVGAITHVFVDDPTKGYGIFAEEMMP